MRSEKTEFAHIDELVRRIALSRFDVTLILRHNGKVVRQYKGRQYGGGQDAGSPLCAALLHAPRAGGGERAQRRAAVGLAGDPEGARPQNDLQYTYVNGRMMRDKLINHAIRQAYDELLPADRFAAYVLYIELDPRQVDVNVHPAKHEVRFHQARLIHDFIFQALFTALRQQGAASDEPLAETLVELPVSAPIEYRVQAPRAEWYGAEHNYRAPAREVREGSSIGRAGNYQPPEPPSREAMRSMGSLLTTLPAVQAEAETAPVAAAVPAKAGTWRALTPGGTGLSAAGAGQPAGPAVAGAGRAPAAALLAAGNLGSGAGGPAAAAAGLLQAAEKPGRWSSSRIVCSNGWGWS